MPTVSIVLPTYNGERYIRESIDSILRQTCEDWELIIVDDCSTDHTLEIANEYADRDVRIRAIHNEVNQKLPGSLNIGFEHTKGKYLTWTSDDNMYLPEALAVMAERLDQSDTPMVCADEYVIDEDGEIREDIVRRYNDDLSLHNMIGACFLYRREILDSVGEYDTELFGAEDYDYWLRIKQKYGKIERIRKVLYKYRFHGNALSFARRETVLLATAKLRKKYSDYILKDLENKKDLLCSLYYEILEGNTAEETDIKERIRTMLPELSNDRVGTKGKYIVFGAGGYGERAFRALNGHVVYFADNDPDKVGKYKNGKEILSYEGMLSLTGQFDIMIAVRYDKVPQLVYQLSKSGLCEYCTLQTFLSE